MFDIDYYPYILPSVTAKIAEERHTHDAIYNAIEEFIYENKSHIIVAGKRSLQKFLKLPEDFMYEVYCINALKYALDIANRLSDILSGEYLIGLDTIIYSNRFVLKVNNRPYLRIDNLRKVQSIEVFSPIIIDRLYVIPPMLQLIQIYAIMYDITKYEDWDTYSDMLKAIQTITGGNVKSELDKFKENFVKGNDDIILIGDIAGGVLYSGNYDCIDMISPLKPDFIMKELQKYRHEKLEYVENDPQLFSDYRLRKYIIRAGTGGKIIANIYNSATYEIIPYFKHNRYNVANKYVLLRFNLIEIWALQVLLAKGNIEMEFFKRKLAFRKVQYDNFMRLEDKKEFFIGEYRDEVLDTKLSKKEKRFTPTYHPQIYMKLTGKYRTMD